MSYEREDWTRKHIETRWDFASVNERRMLTALIKEHRRLVAEVEALQTKIDEERSAALAALPVEFGFPDLDSFIRAVRQAVASTRRQKTPPRKRAPVSATPPPATKRTPTPPPSPSLPSMQAPANPPPVAPAPPPVGTSLDDPANFGLLPDVSLLEQHSQDATLYHGKLSEALKFAQKVLHTSRVPAKVWREWRQFERDATEVLRAANKVSSRMSE